MKPNAFRLGALLLGFFLFTSKTEAIEIIRNIPEDPSSRLSYYRQSLQYDPDNHPLRYYLATTLLSEGKATEAISEFRKVYPDYADTLEINYNLGLAYLQTGDVDSALLYLEQSEELGALEEPELFPLAPLYFNLAITRIEQELLNEAKPLLQRALSLDPTLHEAHRLLGEIYDRQGETASAIAELTVYMQAYPQDGTTGEYLFSLVFNEALLAFDRDDKILATQKFQQALEFSPESPLALYYLGVIAYQQQNDAIAVDYFIKALPTASDDLRCSMHSFLYNSSLHLLKKKEPELALKALSPLLNLTIVDTRYLFHAGNIYLEQLNYPEAIDYFEQVLQKEPGHRRAALNLLASRTSQAKIFFIAGRTAFRKEDFLKARELLSDVLELDPAYPLAREYLDETNSSLSAMARALFDEGESLLASDQPRDALEKISLGRSYAPKDRQGRKLLKKAQEAAAHQIAALMERAEEERAANHFDLAEASYSQVIHLVPDHEEALAALQEIAVQRRTLHDAAVATAKKALEGGDIKAATTQFLAVLEQAPDHLEAQEGLQSAKALLASMVEQILQRARQERSAGRIDNARNEYYEALALREDPIIQKELEALEQQQQEKIDALLASARLAASQGKISKSLTAYDKILHRLPEHKVAKEEKESLIKKRAQDLKELLLRANALLVTENFAEALAIYRRALDLDPRSKEASAGIVDGKKRLSATIATLLQSGNTQLQEGELDAAETSYQKLLALDPYHKQAKGGLEQVAARRSAGVAPGDEKRLYLQGIELYTRGKYLDAVTVWEKVLILSPEHAKARANIEKARRKIRQIEEFRNG